MGKIPLNKDSQFVVGEEKVLNYILALLCFALFLYGIIDAARRHFINIDYQSFVFALAIAPAIYFFRRALGSRVYIRVNKKGIYHHERLVTGWPGLIKAFIAQNDKASIISIQDNFLLIVEYRKDNLRQVFRRKIPLTNTQNKSEEDVLEAVLFFWKQYRDEAPAVVRWLN